MYVFLEKYLKKILCLGFFLSLLSLASPSYALKASADTLGGYAAQVLDTVLRHYVQPIEAKGRTLVLVRIASDGRPYSCEIIEHSQSKEVDEALCVTIARVGKFEEPKGLATVEVALNFVYEDKTSNAMNARQVLAKPQSSLSHPVQASQSNYPLARVEKSEQAVVNSSKRDEPLIQDIGDGIVQKRLEENSTSQNRQEVVSQQSSRNIQREVKFPLPEEVAQEKISTISMSFAQELLENIKPYLQDLPQSIAQGKYRVTYRIKTNMHGQLTGLDVVESSNNYDYDIFVQDIILVKNVIPKPRDGNNQEAIITFIAEQ